MNLKVKGTILGIVSAVSYGTNPLGALFLYQEGLNSNSGFVLSFFIGGSCLHVFCLFRNSHLNCLVKR